MADTLFERFQKAQKGFLKTPPCEGWRNSQEDSGSQHPSRIMYKYGDAWYCAKCLVELFELNAFLARRQIANMVSTMMAPPTLEEILSANNITVWPPSENLKRERALKAA